MAEPKFKPGDVVAANVAVMAGEYAPHAPGLWTLTRWSVTVVGTVVACEPPPPPGKVGVSFRCGDKLQRVIVLRESSLWRGVIVTTGPGAGGCQENVL